LVFPSLEAGNIAYKLMMRMGGAEALGPILMGLAMPVHVLARGSEVEEIVNMAAIAVVHAQLGVLGIQQSPPQASLPPAA
jgi:malate dehydrogenase (oxaloacetate-decarboxylating)(NADP+)